MQYIQLYISGPGPSLHTSLGPWPLGSKTHFSPILPHLNKCIIKYSVVKTNKNLKREERCLLNSWFFECPHPYRAEAIHQQMLKRLLTSKGDLQYVSFPLLHHHYSSWNTNSHLCYYNSLLSGFPVFTLAPLQFIFSVIFSKYKSKNLLDLIAFCYHQSIWLHQSDFYL